MTTFFGKYRGRVTANIDPLFLGRILAEVPALPGTVLNWALPCTPYAGPSVGLYLIPPVGASVWIEFEAGDPNYPIWTGCFWAQGELPTTPAGPPTPETRLFQTEACTLILNDLPGVGGISLTCRPPAVATPITLLLDSTGISLTCPASALKITPASIELTQGTTTVVLTPELLHLAAAQASIDLSGSSIFTSVTVPPASPDPKP